jgi:NADH-quinone oxidoreductase subunit G
MPGLLPIGRWVGDPKARAEVALVWNKAALPSVPGRSTSALLDAAGLGSLGALVIAGVDPADLPDPGAALVALDETPFIVSLELRASAVTDRADVVFPIAAVAEKAGTFVNWEGRGATFAAALSAPGARTDLYVLGAIADEMDVHLGLPSAAAARAELAALGVWKGAHPAPPAVLTGTTSPSGETDHRLATWHQLVDAGRMQDGEPYLAATARPVVARISPEAAAAAGLHDGDKVTVESALGSVTVPLDVTEKMVDGVVWLPTNSPGSAVRAGLGAGHGSRVTLRRAE